MANTRLVQASESESTKGMPKRRPRKHADGEGLLRKREDGLWEGRLMVGVRPDGRPDVRSVYGKSQEEALTKLTDLRQRHRTNTVTEARAERQTVASYLEHWLAMTGGTVRASTWHRYGQYVRLQLIPGLGRHRLATLRPGHLQQFYKAALGTGQSADSSPRGTKKRAGLSARTVHHLHVVLHRALHQAVRWGVLTRNVADAVDPPRVPKVELHPPTPEQIVRLLDTAERVGDPFHALWTVAVYTGCRRGELLGLQWADLDLEAGTLSVGRTLVGAHGRQPQFGEPKTERSRRTVALPHEAVEALRQHRACQVADRQAIGPDYAPFDLVFATRLGTPYLGRNITRAFKAALGRAGLPATIRLHDLRHAAATTLRQAGVDLKTVSERLGHSTIGITGDLYTHAVPNADVEAAAKLQAAIRTARVTLQG